MTHPCNILKLTSEGDAADHTPQILIHPEYSQCSVLRTTPTIRHLASAAAIPGNKLYLASGGVTHLKIMPSVFFNV